MVEFLKDLFGGVFWSISAIGTVVGIVSFVLYLLSLGGKMKTLLSKRRPLLLWVFFIGVLCSVISASYTAYKDIAIAYRKQETEGAIVLFFVSANVDVLNQINKRKDGIKVKLDASHEKVLLEELSQRPYFSDFLSFKKSMMIVPVEEAFYRVYYLFPTDLLKDRAQYPTIAIRDIE